MTHTASSHYRPEIDGLRAVAILGVLVYHLDGALLPGGFVGVDVFFVISGYLLSGIIDRQLRAGSFSLVRFYEKRVRRIFPALLAVTVAVMVAGYWLLLPDALEEVAKSVRYVMTATSNLLFLKNGQDYFHESLASVPLLHTWSLAVEEQFYVFFPLILWVSYRYFKSTRARLAPIAILFALSLGASAWMVTEQPMKAFFLLPPRAWEMLLGALVALAPLAAGRRGGAETLSLAGLAMVAASMAMFDRATPFPGLSALLPCGGAALLLFAGKDERTWTHKLLSFRPVVGLGAISYSVYLWHWPLIAFAQDAEVFHGWVPGMVFVVSLSAGYLSWRWIENPFRNPGYGSRKQVFAGWAAVSACVVALGMVAERAGGFPGRLPAAVQRIIAFKKKSPQFERFSKMRGVESPLVFGTAGVAPRFAVWGDSHGGALVPGLEEAAASAGQSFKLYGKGALPPVAGIADRADKHADRQLAYSEAVLAAIAADAQIGTVVLAARWSLYCEGQNETDERWPGFVGLEGNSKPEMERFFAGKVRATIAKLVAAGKRIVLVYPVPELGANAPDRLAKQVAGGLPMATVMPCPDFFARNQFMIGVLDSVDAAGRIERIRPYETLLNEGYAKVSENGQVFYMDDDHLSEPGARFLTPMLARIFTQPQPSDR